MPPSVKRPSLKQALREVLTNAFQGLELDMLVDDMFGKKLGDLVFSEKSAPEVMFSLINQVETRSELGYLIDGAMYRKPSNFNKFILDYLEEIFTILELELDKFSGKDLNNLVEIIQNSKAVKLAAEACIKTLPDGVSQDYPEEIKRLNADQTPDAYRLYIVFKLLLSYPKDGENFRIFNFIETLSKQEKIKSDLRGRLKEFLPPHLLPSAIEPNPTIADKIKEIFPSGRKKKIGRLNGYLLIEVKKSSIGKSKLYLTSSLQYGDDPDDFLPIDLVDSLQEISQRGTSCNYKNLAQTVSKLINLGENKFHTNQGNAAGSLILEFFLPCDYLLAETIDLWKIELIPGDAVSIGSRYGIILRSSDRMNNPNLLSGLKKTWERLENLLDQQPKRKITPKKWREQFFHLEKLDGLKEDKSKLEQKIGIKLTCGLPDDKAIQEQLVKEIILTDLPFVIWNRSKTLASAHDLSKEMDRFLKIEHFQDRMKLLDCVQKERARFAGSDNPENYLGHHLAFLYDDPYRPLPQLQLFSTE
jgi:hypothetical protein